MVLPMAQEEHRFNPGDIIPMTLLGRIKCFLGYHDWKDTGIRRAWGFLGYYTCTRCKTGTEFAQNCNEYTEEVVGEYKITHRRKP